MKVFPLIAAVVLAAVAAPGALAQAPDNQSAYVVTYIEVTPSAEAEAANLLMAENRARDKDQWMKDAKLLWEAGNKAFILAKAKDEAGIEALNAELYEACQSCHVHYRPGYRRRP